MPVSFLAHIPTAGRIFQQRSAGDIGNRLQSNDTVAAFLSREMAETALGFLTILFIWLS